MDQPHAQLSEMSSRASLPTDLHMNIIKNTPRLQCAIPSTSTGVSRSQTPIEPLETTSVAPASNSMDNRTLSPLIVDFNQSSSDHRITSLERSLCTDFVCCNIQLSDFHALLEHFEEDHVVVLAPNGKRVYPPEGLRAVPLHPISSRATTPASSRSSSVAPSSPPSPQTPSSSGPPSPSSAAPFATRKSSLGVAPIYTPFTPSLPVDPAYPYPDAEIVMTDGEATFEYPEPVQPDFYSILPAMDLSSQPSTSASSSEDEEMSDESSPSSSVLDASTSTIPTYVFGTDKAQPIGEIPKHVRILGPGVKGKGSADNTKAALKAALATARSIAASSSKSNKSKRASVGLSNSHSRRREKAYHCPTPRCSKSYLNPNGLKYHIEKGTCKLDGDDDLSMNEDAPDAEPDSVPSSSSTPSALLPSPSIDCPQSSTTADRALGTASIPNLPNAHLGVSQPLEIAQPQPIQGTSSVPYCEVVASQSRPQSARPSSTSAGAKKHQYQYPPKQFYPSGGEETIDSSLVTPPISVPSPQQQVAMPPLPVHPQPHPAVQMQTSQQPQQQFQYHYPVPSYPQSYAVAAYAATHPSHRPYYASPATTEGAVYYTPPPMAGAGSIASARSQ